MSRERCDLSHRADIQKEYRYDRVLVYRAANAVREARTTAKAEGEVLVMVIEPRMIVGGAAAFALVGAVLWGSAVLLTPAPVQVSNGTVEISPVDDKAWMVEVQDLGPSPMEKTRTAANH